MTSFIDNCKLVTIAVNFISCICIQTIFGETRCHCNLPACVGTGYMCKSKVGACFSQLQIDRGRVHVDHACAEMLPEVKKQACVDYSDNRVRQVEASDRGLICCSEDMCNYYHRRTSFDLDPDIRREESTGSISPYSERPMKALKPAGLSDSPNYDVIDDAERSRRHLFEVAVIVVLVVGIIVLVVIVVASVHLISPAEKPELPIVYQCRFHGHSWLKPADLDRQRINSSNRTPPRGPTQNPGYRQNCVCSQQSIAMNSGDNLGYECYPCCSDRYDDDGLNITLTS